MSRADAGADFASFLTLRRCRVLGFAYLGAAAVCGALVPVLFGAPLPMVYVAWRGVDEAQRTALEQRFRLSEPKRQDARAWSYVPLDTSSGMLGALIAHPAVEYTDGIDRRWAAIAPNGPLTERRGGVFPGAPRLLPRLLKLTAYVCTLLGTLALIVVIVSSEAFDRGVRAVLRDARAHPAATVRAAGGAVARFLERGVPVASAEAAGVFRMVFLTLALAFVLSQPVDPGMLAAYEVGLGHGPYGVVVSKLAAVPSLVRWIPAVLVVAAACAIAGFRTRVTYACFAAAVLAWACVYTVQTTHHTVSALVLAILGLVAAPWGDAWSVDAWLARRRGEGGPHAAGRRYAYAMWLPAFVLGLTFAAAAWAKLRGGPAWILNGTVRYHFVSDLDHALVSWGPTITRYAGVAVAMSAAGVLIEAATITAAFRPSALYRAAIGLAALSLLVGFALFQGVFWKAWWLLLLGFVPWERVRRPAAAGAGPGSLSRMQLAIVVAFVLQQVYASAFRVEARPFVSAYDMYSTTYDSPESYEKASNLVYRVVAVTSRGTMDLRDCQIDDRTAALFRTAARGGAADARRLRDVLAPCLAERPDVSVVRLEGDRRVYDWARGRAEWKRRLDVIGPIRVDARGH